MKKLFLLLAWTVGVNPMFAQIFYVSTTGNDANAGTLAAPWKTLAKATSTVTSGTIEVLAGTYTETVSSSLNPNVNIHGQGMATTIVKSAITGDWSTLLQIESNSLINGNNTVSDITFDGQYVSETNYKTWIGMKTRFRHNVVLNRVKFVGFYDRGYIIEGNGDNRSTIPIDPKIYSTGLKVLNCVFTNTARNSPNYIAGQLNIGGTKDMLIDSCTFLQNQRVAGKNGEPIKYWGSGYNNGLKLLNSDLRKLNFTSNQFNGSNGDWGFAFEMFNVTGLEIANCYLQGAIDLSYSRVVAPYTFSAWIHNNTSDHTPANNKEEFGIIFEFETAGALVENNKFYNASCGITFNIRTPNENGGYNNPKPTGGYSATTNINIRNNLFANLYSAYAYGNCCSASGIQFLTEGDSKDGYVRNFQVVNNTFATRSGFPSVTGIDLTHFTAPAASTDGITIRNNIFQGFSGAYLDGGSSKMLNTVTRDNDIYQCGNNNNPSWTGSLTNTGNLNLNPNFTATYTSPLFTSNNMGWNGGGTVTQPSPCTSYTYSDWICNTTTGIKSRTVLSALPNGCVGGAAPILTDTCTIVVPNCTYTYSTWGACVNGVQTRTVTSVTPANCIGTPILSQACTVIVPSTDTTYCTVILHGANLTRNTATYFVKRADGFFYDNNGRKREIYLFKSIAGIWYYLSKFDSKFYQLF